MRSLPSKFDVIVTTIEETKDLSKFTVNELHALLMTHEQRLERSVNPSLEHAFKTQMPFGRGRGQAKEEEEAEAKTEKEETTLHIHMEGSIVRIKATNMLKDKSMTNQMSNVIIAKNMGTMPMSVGKRKMT